MNIYSMRPKRYILIKRKLTVETKQLSRDSSLTGMYVIYIIKQFTDWSVCHTYHKTAHLLDYQPLLSRTQMQWTSLLAQCCECTSNIRHTQETYTTMHVRMKQWQTEFRYPFSEKYLRIKTERRSKHVWLASKFILWQLI
jgi:hypothetical protein